MYDKETSLVGSDAIVGPDKNNLCQLLLAPGQVFGAQAKEAFNYYRFCLIHKMVDIQNNIIATDAIIMTNRHKCWCSHLFYESHIDAMTSLIKLRWC